MNSAIATTRWPWFVVGAIAYLSFGFTEMMGSDLWWHVAAGREVLQQGTPWLVDDWSFTELGSTWHNHEWLSDLVFYGWVLVFGLPSVVIWKWLLIVGTFTMLQSVLTRLSGGASAALVASVIAAAMAAPFLDVRPQLYTLLGIVLLLHFALQRTPRLPALLALFVVWANLHGGVVFGLMLLGFLVFPWQSMSWSNIRRAVIVVGSCAAACLLTPDFVRIFWIPLVYAFDSSSPYRGLAEWRSPFIAGGIHSPLYIYSLMVSAALLCLQLLPSIRRRMPVLLSVVAFVLLTGAMSATSRRFTILWALAFALLLQPYLSQLFRQRFFQPLLLPLLLVIALGGVWRINEFSLRPAVAYHYLTAEYAYPHGLADFIEQNHLTGNVFAYYNWGGFLHWRSDGAFKVFIDGRANTLFDDDTYRYYVAVAGARPGWLERIEQSEADFFLWPRARRGQRLIDGLLNTQRWTSLYEDARGVLLVRQGHPLPPTLRIPRGTVAADLAEARTATKRGDYDVAASAAQRALAAKPWDRAACSAVKQAKQLAGDQRAAQQVIERCRAYFASRFLR